LSYSIMRWSSRACTSVLQMRAARFSLTSLMTLSRIKLDNTLIIYIAGNNGDGAEGTLVGMPNEVADDRGVEHDQCCP
jgi:hypothetical protein